MMLVKLFCTSAKRSVRTVSGAAGPITVYPDGGSARDSCNCMSRREDDPAATACSSIPAKRRASMMEGVDDVSPEVTDSACAISQWMCDAANDSRGTYRSRMMCDRHQKITVSDD